MVPEIKGVTEWVLGHFLPFDPPNNAKNRNFEKMKKKAWRYYHFYIYVSKIMIIWSLVPKIWSATDRIFCHSGPFLPSYPTNNMKNQKFENMKNTWDISILYLCTTNDNHMMYSSWDMEQDRQNFLSFWAFFFALLPTPLATPKKHNFEIKNWRHHFTLVHHNWRSYDV